MLGAAAALLLLAKPATARDRQVSCTAERGAAAATRLQEACKGVSPATHPPCGAANSCALIEDEIARSCSIIGATVASATPACSLAPLAPAAVLRRYYEAIDERDYDTAYAMLKPDGGAVRGFSAFRDDFAQTTATYVESGRPSAVEWAAGSSFVTVPVVVEATLDDGSRQRFTGTYVLRATNAPGPVPDTRWFIVSADLHEVGR